MLASRTINGNDDKDMIIYYKNSKGLWIDAITGENIEVPNSFDIEVLDLENEDEITTTNPNYATKEIKKDDIASSTYVIGNYIYTRNKNEKYDGILNTCGETKISNL